MSKCAYTARIKLCDKTNFRKEWEREGEADEVLIEAMSFIGLKDSDTVFKSVVDYLHKDWEAFDNYMNKILKVNNGKPK